MESSEGYYVQLNQFERDGDLLIARLPHAMTFTKRWMCALVEAVITRPSIMLEENDILYNRTVVININGRIRGFRLEPGEYKDGKALINEINDAIAKSRGLASGSLAELEQRFGDFAPMSRAKRQADKANVRLVENDGVITVEGAGVRGIWLAPGLRHLLKLDASGGQLFTDDVIDICTDFVGDTILNQSTAPLLQSIYVPHDVVHVRFAAPHYVPVMSQHFDSVHIRMYSNGRVLRSGQLRLIKLHFRPERYHLPL